ncbi:MAG TPA: hypothetical protein VMJ12_01030 [Candidatus Acidoferrales bacterium]|nr:hypothetical protein [Candidatus Acidoferrales bacterium]
MKCLPLQIRSAIFVLTGFTATVTWAQIDPYPRNLVQFGYNQALEGHYPFAGYIYYYHNEPDFLRTNLTLRLALSPTYVDSDFGFIGGLGPKTDFSLGLAGGAFADNYYEIRDGTYYPDESFNGYGGGASANIYHLFNPASRIPLYFVLRGGMHYSTYADTDNTAPNFQLPNNHATFAVRTGLRWGGMEPTLFPALAMELSVWYEGQFRTDSGAYGFNDDRHLNSESQLFWFEGALAYTFPKSKQNITVRLSAGGSIDADRFSAYRLGGFLPLESEFPLSMPGYAYQEISASQFVLLNASYLLPLDKKQRWNVGVAASTAAVDYLSGEGQPGNWLNGVGTGLLYRSPSDRWSVLVGYGYGINAVRSDGRGANNIGILIQWNLGRKPGQNFNLLPPLHFRGLQPIFGR